MSSFFFSLFIRYSISHNEILWCEGKVIEVEGDSYGRTESFYSLKLDSNCFLEAETNFNNFKCNLYVENQYFITKY